MIWRHLKNQVQPIEVLRLVFAVLFSLYALTAIHLTLLPVSVQPGAQSWDDVIFTLSRVNLVPLRFGGLFELNPNYAIRELGGNILLTIPFGFGLPFLMRIRPRALPWLALAPGLSIELAQLTLKLALGSYRTVDINDVILNATGVLIGYALFRVLAHGWGLALPAFTKSFDALPAAPEKEMGDN